MTGNQFAWEVAASAVGTFVGGLFVLAALCLMAVIVDSRWPR